MIGTSDGRSRIMRAVKSVDTKPEMAVRRLLHGMGYRYRLHRKDLPGRPDIVFSSRKKIIFVHGCFWHGHNCKRGARVPKTNRDYWVDKIERNRRRDNMHSEQLKKLGWSILSVWECEMKDVKILQFRLRDFLSKPATRYPND